eukprot:gene18063-21515_t
MALMKGEKRMHQLKGHGTHSNVKLCITALVLVVALLWVTYRKNDQGVTSSGDVLVFAGDWTDGEYTTSAQVADFDAWMGLLPHPHKVTTTRPQLKKVAIPKGEVMITGSHDGMEGHGSKSRVEVMVSGNHDIMEGDGELSEAGLQMKMAGLFQHVRLINDQSYAVPLGNGETVLLYGMPWQPQYGPGYQLPSGPEMQSKLDAIPV